MVKLLWQAKNEVPPPSARPSPPRRPLVYDNLLQKIDAGCAPEDAHEQAMAAAAAARREPPSGRDREEVESLHRELREAQVGAR